MTDPTTEHPSQWSPEVLVAMTPVLRQLHMAIHDPFAGTGVRLGALCDKLRLTFTGTELEQEFIVEPRVRQGDSTWPDSYPTQPHVIVTSPVYPNGMADHFRASEPEGRHTYRQAIHRLTGEDRPLHESNMGRYSIRRGEKAFQTYAVLATAAAGWWFPSVVVLNVSDFYVGDERFPLVRYWRELLKALGYKFAADIEVKTRRQGHGVNRDRRVECEVILTAFPREDFAPSQPVDVAYAYRKLAGRKQRELVSP